MGLFIFIIMVVFSLLIMFYVNKTNETPQSHSVEMDVPNPSKASKEKVLNFIDIQPSYVIEQVYQKFISYKVDFNGMEKYYIQKKNDKFDFNKAMNECYPSSNRKTIIKNTEELDFTYFEKKKPPSKTYLRDSKIPNKFLHPRKELEDKSHYFYNKKIVISGSFKNFPYRAEIAKILWEVGADVDMKVTEKTNILLSGNGVGWKKLETAQTNGVEIMSEETFLNHFPNYETTFQ